MIWPHNLQAGGIPMGKGGTMYVARPFEEACFMQSIVILIACVIASREIINFASIWA